MVFFGDVFRDFEQKFCETEKYSARLHCFGVFTCLGCSSKTSCLRLQTFSILICLDVENNATGQFRQRDKKNDINAAQMPVQKNFVVAEKLTLNQALWLVGCATGALHKPEKPPQQRVVFCCKFREYLLDLVISFAM